MMDFILQHIPLPYTLNDYGAAAIADQISMDLVTISHIPTTLVALALVIFLYKNSKQLSTFYLLLMTIAFSLWGFFDLMSWTSDARTLMFGWSLLAVFGITFTFLSYWFLYVFVTGKDVPNWQKVLSILTIVPVYIGTITGANLSDYYYHAITPLESANLNLYIDVFNITFLIIITAFTLYQTRKAQTTEKRVSTFLAGLGVIATLFFFSFTVIITNTLVWLEASGIMDVGITTGEAYNASTYGLFGMPIMVALLGYLVVKHQAFGVKVLKSVGYIILLMILLFVWVFI